LSRDAAHEEDIIGSTEVCTDKYGGISKYCRGCQR
jgi:hypothetical protein